MIEILGAILRRPRIFWYLVRKKYPLAEVILAIRFCMKKPIRIWGNNTFVIKALQFIF